MFSDFFACFLVIVLHAIPNAPVGLGHAGVALFFSILRVPHRQNSDEGRTRCGPFMRGACCAFIRPTLRPFSSSAVSPLRHSCHDPRLGSLFWHNLGYYLTFTFQLSPDSSHLPLLIVWSLCVEELFYLFLPLIFLLGTKVRVAFALGCIVGLLLTPRFFLLPNGTGTWFLLPLNLFFGVGLALLRPKLTSLFPFIAIGAVALLVINCFYSWFHSFGPISALLCTTTVWSPGRL